MAPVGRLHLCLCLCLALLLPPPAAPVPVPGRAPRTDWVACRNLSRELSRLVATLKEPHGVVEDTHLSEEDPKNWPPRIRCSDACDPSTLDTNNTVLGMRGAGVPCLRGSGCPSAAASDPLTPLSPQQEHGRVPRHPMAPSKAWTHSLLQRLALQRLQSFTAIMSRVFTHSAS
ncbi:IL23A protein, partial [Rhynochetos jubatus]|nr:IL23A protein [Rhynochetos jubatus]